MSLLLKVKAAAEQLLNNLVASFEPQNPADREVDEGRRQLAAERIRKSAK